MRNYDDYHNEDIEEVNKKCEKDEMMAYGLTGDSRSLDSESSFCPNI